MCVVYMDKNIIYGPETLKQRIQRGLKYQLKGRRNQLLEPICFLRLCRAQYRVSPGIWWGGPSEGHPQLPTGWRHTHAHHHAQDTEAV